MEPEHRLITGEDPPPPKKNGNKLGFFGLLALLFTKFKFLLLGLLKIKTLLSMLVFFGVYWDRWGWKFALGFVLSIYIHEMGHVNALRRYGIEATAPLFIPFVGAFIRVKQAFADPIQDARVGLAGPFWGLGAALGAFALFFFTGESSFAAIGHTGAWINLFNLIPFWQLDGGRGFHSLNRTQRGLAFAALGGILFFTQEVLLAVLLGFALFQCFRKQIPERADWTGFFQYIFLVLILVCLCQWPVPDVSPS